MLLNLMALHRAAGTDCAPTPQLQHWHHSLSPVSDPTWDQEMLTGQWDFWPLFRKGHKLLHSRLSAVWMGPAEKELLLLVKAPGDDVEPPCAPVHGTCTPCCQLQFLAKGAEKMAKHPLGRRGNISLNFIAVKTRLKLGLENKWEEKHCLHNPLAVEWIRVLVGEEECSFKGINSIPVAGSSWIVLLSWRAAETFTMGLCALCFVPMVSPLKKAL